MLVDSHCHLDLTSHSSLDAIMQAASEHDVEHFLCVSVELAHFDRLCAIAAQYPNISISVGLHPNSEVAVEPSSELLVQLAKHNKCIAIGETGLDYYRSQGDLSWQQQRFRNHIHAALQANKPLIIHTRAAAEDTIQILRLKVYN